MAGLRHSRRLKAWIPPPERVLKRAVQHLRAPVEDAFGAVATPAHLLALDHATADRDDSSLFHLDPGEEAAICLAKSEAATLLLMDDAAGRLQASRRGITTREPSVLLRVAARSELLDLPTALSRLTGTNFRAPPSLLEQLLAEDAELGRR